MNTKNLAIGATVIAMTFAGANFVFGQSTNDTNIVPELTNMLDESTAEKIALDTVSGTIYKIDTETDAGREIYEVYVKSENGQITEVEIDRQTGEVIATDERHNRAKRKKDKGRYHDSDNA